MTNDSNSRDEWDAMAEVTRRPVPTAAERDEHTEVKMYSPPLPEILYTFAKAWAGLLAGNNSPRVNAVAERARHPRAGDLVFERTHRLRQCNADVSATLGILLAIEQRPLYPAGEWDDVAEGRPCPTETAYVIRTLDGRRFTWTNASLVALPVCTGEAWEVAAEGGSLGEMRTATTQERADSLFVTSYTRMLPAVREWLTTSSAP